MPTFLFREKSIFYASHGDGPDVLLIHGAGGNAMNWSPELRRLPGYTVSAIDLPGHGKSGDAPPLSTIADFVALVQAWAAALEAQTFALVGHSLGAAIALQVTLDLPQRVTHLVVIGGAPKIEVDPGLLNALSSGDSSIYTKLTRRSYGVETSDQELANYEAHLRKVPPEVLWGAFAACAEFDVFDRLSEIAIPVAVVGSTDDRMIPAQGSIDLAAYIKEAEIHLLVGVGHMLHIEAPEVLEEVLLEMLEAAN